MKKTIWMCWFQGEEDESIPKLNKECIKRWRELNADHDVRVLCNKTIPEYIPEFVDIIKSSPNRSHQAQSDLLRVLLLAKYGGIWADTSVFPMQPLSDFYNEIVNDTGFFTYRFMPRVLNKTMGDRETVSWFICTNKTDHYLVEKWKTEFAHRFTTMNNWKYFTFHQTLTDLYDEDVKVKFIIDNMVQINEKRPHSAMQNWKNKNLPVSQHMLDSFMYKRPKYDLICGE